MEINEFIEYAKIIEKNKAILEEFDYEIYMIDDEIELETENMFGDTFKDINSPKELDKMIKEDLIEVFKESLLNKIENKKQELQDLENLLKSVDN